MHTVLKQTTLDRAFAPQIAVAADVAQWAVATKKRIEKAFESLSIFRTGLAIRIKSARNSYFVRRKILLLPSTPLPKSEKGRL